MTAVQAGAGTASLGLLAGVALGEPLVEDVVPEPLIALLEPVAAEPAAAVWWSWPDCRCVRSVVRLLVAGA